MRNRTYDKDFKLDCVKYCAEHLELSQAEAARNLNVPEKTLNRWLVNSKKQGDDAFRGSGKIVYNKVRNLG